MKDNSNLRPLCSILIPVFNRAGLIEETVHCALNQSISDIEVVVVDNCSTDGTWEKLVSLSRCDPRVCIFQNESNLGPVRNWCRCLDEAKGAFAKILWSDDLISSDFLEKTIPWLKDPDVSLVFTAVTEFENSRNTAIRERYKIGPTGYYPSFQFIFESLLFGNYPYSPGCALFRLEDLRRSMEIDIPNRLGADFSQLAIGNDLLLFLNTAARHTKFAFVNEALSFFRNHPDSITVKSKTRQIYYTIAKSHFLASHPDKYLSENYSVMLFWISVSMLLVSRNWIRPGSLCPPGVCLPINYFYLFPMLFRLLRRIKR